MNFPTLSSSHYPAPYPSPHYNWSTLWLRGCDLVYPCWPNKSLDDNTLLQYCQEQNPQSKCKHKHITTVLAVIVQISTVYIKLYQAVYSNSSTSVNDKVYFQNHKLPTSSDKCDCSTFFVRKKNCRGLPACSDSAVVGRRCVLWGGWGWRKRGKGEGLM